MTVGELKRAPGVLPPLGGNWVQAGGMIFTSSRHVSPRHRLRGRVGDRDHPVPGTRLPLGHCGDPHKESLSCHVSGSPHSPISVTSVPHLQDSARLPSLPFT